MRHGDSCPPNRPPCVGWTLSRPALPLGKVAMCLTGHFISVLGSRRVSVENDVEFILSRCPSGCARPSQKLGLRASEGRKKRRATEAFPLRSIVAWPCDGFEPGKRLRPEVAIARGSLDIVDLPTVGGRHPKANRSCFSNSTGLRYPMVE